LSHKCASVDAGRDAHLFAWNQFLVVKRRFVFWGSSVPSKPRLDARSLVSDPGVIDGVVSKTHRGRYIQPSAAMTGSWYKSPARPKIMSQSSSGMLEAEGMDGCKGRLLRNHSVLVLHAIIAIDCLGFDLGYDCALEDFEL
jgi:hypothetical protein